DYRLPGRDGLELIKELSERYPSLKVVMLSCYDSQVFILSAIAHGASGFISKFDDIKEIPGAIQKIHASGFYFNEKVMSYLVDQLKEKGSSYRDIEQIEIQFSGIETKVIQLMSEEYTSKEIATKLNKSVRSIDSVKQGIMKKSGATNACGIVMFGVRNGLIPIDPISNKV